MMLDVLEVAVLLPISAYLILWKPRRKLADQPANPNINSN